MKIIQTHSTFYVELSTDGIILCPKSGICSSYPVWLGKNRAVMREAIAFFEKNPPETIIEFMEVVSKFELNGIMAHTKRIPELFTDPDKPLDETRTFW